MSNLDRHAKGWGGGVQRSSFGPNVKKPTSWTKKGGGDSGPPDPHLCFFYLCIVVPCLFLYCCVLSGET